MKDDDADDDDYDDDEADPEKWKLKIDMFVIKPPEQQHQRTVVVYLPHIFFLFLFSTSSTVSFNPVSAKVKSPLHSVFVLLFVLILRFQWDKVGLVLALSMFVGENV